MTESSECSGQMSLAEESGWYGLETGELFGDS
jgi:hypothetical protein